MSNNYDNWERLVDVVLRREKDRRLALAESRGSSFSSSISSSFRFGPDSPFHHQNPPPEAYTVNLLGDKMGILGIEGKRWEEIGYWIEPAILDDMINRLLGFSSTVTQEVLSEHEILTLCVASRKIFISQPNFLELDAPVKICSNIHGHYGDLLRLFKYAGFPPAANYLFFGGYVDYGIQSIETICLLLAYKIKYPQNFFILRGNHERTSVNRICGLYDECKHRYNVRLWEVLVDCFDCLPVAAIINEKILCINGGLSTDLHNLDQIRNMPRPTAVPDTGLISDILWSVPRNFGPDNVTEILTHLDLDITRRDHEVVENGYRFFADGRLITIFSAPNFSDEFNNSGEILCIDDNLMCKIQIMKSANV